MANSNDFLPFNDYVCFGGRYVELEEVLSLKDKEILEKTHRLEELSMQVSNKRPLSRVTCCCVRSKVLNPV